MASIICHHNGKYNFYSTVSDGFRYQSALTLEQVRQAVEEEGGKAALRRLTARLERAHQYGNSSLQEIGLEEFLCCNRAGENEVELSYDECIKRFLS